MQFESNRDLYDYLVRPAQILEARGAAQLAALARDAAKQAAGMSTEFLGEARLGLQRISTQGRAVLSDLELAEVQSAIIQIDGALNRPLP